MKLARTQAALYRLIVGAPGADRTLAKQIVAPVRPLSALQRVAIYGRQYPARMQESLEDDYPELARLLGEAKFARLRATYTRAHPSDHPDLGAFGRKLPAFLKRWRGGRPDAGDLARLEWTRTEVFFEANVEPAPRDALKTVAPEQFPAARVELIPALRVLRLAYDVLPLWRALEEGEAAPKPRRAVCHAVVWRQDFTVFHASATAAEAAALRAAAKGATLAQVMAPFARVPEGPQAAFKALSTWLSEGMVARVAAP